MLDLKDFVEFKIENSMLVSGGYVGPTTLDGQAGGDTLDSNGSFWVNHATHSEERCRNANGGWGPC